MIEKTREVEKDCEIHQQHLCQKQFLLVQYISTTKIPTHSVQQFAK